MSVESTSLATVTVNESCDLTDLSCHFISIGEFFTSLILWAYESVVMGLASFFDAIPLPAFLTNMTSYRLPDVVAWAAEPFALPSGVAIIATAYTLRFIIRRLPVIG